MIVESDTLLLADVFESFRNVSWIYVLDPFSYCIRISMASSFKKDQSIVRSFN